MTLTYRGGPEPFILVGARGQSNIIHGETALLDLLRMICNDY